MNPFAQQIQSLASSLPESRPETVDSVAAERARKIGEANRNAIMDALIKKPYPVSTREIAKATGINWELVRKWCVRMANEGQIVRSGETGKSRYGVQK